MYINVSIHVFTYMYHTCTCTMYMYMTVTVFACCAALIGDSHVMGWGSKAIEIRAVENGQLDGVFMHKRTQKLRFLCERNDKVHHIMYIMLLW